MVLTVSPGKTFREIKGVPYELRIDEEPPVASTTGLPPVADSPAWVPMPGTTPKDIVPGSSFPDAPLLEPGSYKTTLMPGELQLYKVKADWGQRIQAQVSVPELTGATGEAVRGIRYLDTALISPIGEDVYAVFAKDAPGNGGKRAVLTKRGIVQGLTTKEIRYLNRGGPNNQDTGTSTPGEYYVAVSLTRKANDTAFTIPMTLTVGLEGTAGTGKPQYVNGATPVAGDSITPSVQPSQPSGDKTEAGGPISDSPASDRATPVALIAGLGAGALLLALVGGGPSIASAPGPPRPAVHPRTPGSPQPPTRTSSHPPARPTPAHLPRVKAPANPRASQSPKQPRRSPDRLKAVRVHGRQRQSRSAGTSGTQFCSQRSNSQTAAPASTAAPAKLPTATHRRPRLPAACPPEGVLGRDRRFLVSCREGLQLRSGHG